MIILLFKVNFIILLYQELKFNDEKQKLIKNPIMESNSKLKTFKERILVILLTVLTYKAYWKSKKMKPLDDSDIEELLKNFYNELVILRDNDIINCINHITSNIRNFSNFSTLEEKWNELKILRFKAKF